MRVLTLPHASTDRRLFRARRQTGAASITSCVSLAAFSSAITGDSGIITLSLIPSKRHGGRVWAGVLHKSFSEAHMLYTLAVILLIAWLLGAVGTYTIGAFVHVLLVIAIVLFLVGLISGRSTLA
jgi:hypothetical protein